MSKNTTAGQRLKLLRESKGLSLSQLAAKTKTLSKSRISNYEQEIRVFDVPEAKEFALALGCSTAYLLCIEEDPTLSDEHESLAKRIIALPAELKSYVASI